MPLQRDRRDLPRLLDLLTSAVTTLDAAGADSYADLHLRVGARRRGRPFGVLVIEGHRLALNTAEPSVGNAGYLQSDHDGNRRALLLAELCYIIWHWRWDGGELAAYLGCGGAQLDGWIWQSQGRHVPVLPEAVAHRARRLAIVEHHRLAFGVPDAEVAEWIRTPRQGLGDRSMFDLLCNDGEAGFRRIEIWLLNGLAPSATVH